VEVMLRPADLALEPAPEGPSVVVGRRFRGPETVYEVRLASGRVVRCRVVGEGTLPLGTRVRVRPTCARTVVFPAEPEG
jgi:iron(III) transport system ATP-binding protein